MSTHSTKNNFNQSTEPKFARISHVDPEFKGKVYYDIDDSTARIVRYTCGLYTFDNLRIDAKHGVTRPPFALVFGDLDELKQTSQSPLVRVNSGCYTGDILGATDCDCNQQLIEAIDYMQLNGGVIIYHPEHEARGAGFNAHVGTIVHKRNGMDTYEAHRAIGHDPDVRDYEPSAQNYTGSWI